jgi:hypothetical protein
MLRTIVPYSELFGKKGETSAFCPGQKINVYGEKDTRKVLTGQLTETQKQMIQEIEESGSNLLIPPDS